MAQRLGRLDALRGLAIVWMALFHFGFDLNYYGLLSPHQDLHHDPFWTVQRAAIVSLFLFCAGLGQAVALGAARGGPHWPLSFWRRWAQVAGCALLVSIGSAFMFPRSWISFGVLHGIAVMLIVCRLAAPLRGWLWPLGAIAIALPRWLQDPFFDTPLTNWVGLVTHKPITEDYVPVLPWLGVMLWGLAAGQWLLSAPGPTTYVVRPPRGARKLEAARRFLVSHRRAVLAGALPRVLQPLALLGRWSLSFYMLHQPLLIGSILAWRSLGLTLTGAG